MSRETRFADAASSGGLVPRWAHGLLCLQHYIPVSDIRIGVWSRSPDSPDIRAKMVKIPLNPAEKPSVWMQLFFEIVRAAYLGQRYGLGSATYNLSPRIVRPYDFSRRITKTSDEYDRLMTNLDNRFRDAAGTDLYRKNTGWLDRGVRESKIRIIHVDKELQVLPVLARERVVAIDTSGEVFGFFNIPDYESAYQYLEKHLALPKTHNHAELHWSKLSPENRQKVLARFPTFLQISCDALLVIKTDALVSPSGKRENILTNLIDGCFSGHEDMEDSLKSSLRRHLYALTNRTPIHCDADFAPLTPLQMATTYVKRLGQGLSPNPTPTFVNLRSHESRPIQVADILVGAIRTRLAEAKPDPLVILRFDHRKLKRQKGKTASAYCWTTIDVGKPSDTDAASSGGRVPR